MSETRGSVHRKRAYEALGKMEFVCQRHDEERVLWLLARVVLFGLMAVSVSIEEAAENVGAIRERGKTP